MLQSIRDNTQGWLTSTVIGLLIIVFALWGLHGFLELHNERGDKTIVSIAGQTLSQRDFDTAYQRLYRQTQDRLGSKLALDDGLIAQLKKQTVEQWVLMQILAQSAGQENYRISQSEIDSALLTMPIFQVSGRFSSTRFYNVLDAMAYTELHFLADLKKTLLIQQVQQGVIQTAFSLPNELKRSIALMQQKRDFAYIIIPSSQFSAKQLSISDSQAFAYYQKNKAQFTQPEQVSIDYIKLSLANAKNDKAFIAERDKLANITYTHPNSLGMAAKKLGLAIQSSPWFDRLGGKDPLTKNPKVIAAAFSQDSLQGNNSPVIDLKADTSLVLRVKQHKASAIQSFSTVKAQIMQILKKRLAAEKTQALGEKLLSQLKEKGSFSEKTSQYSLHWLVINQAGRYGDKLPERLLNAVFNLPHPQKTGKIASFDGIVLKNGDYILVKLIAVHDGNSTNISSDQKKIYNKSLEENFGQLDYELYERGLMTTHPN